VTRKLTRRTLLNLVVASPLAALLPKGQAADALVFPAGVDPLWTRAYVHNQWALEMPYSAESDELMGEMMASLTRAAAYSSERTALEIMGAAGEG